MKTSLYTLIKKAEHDPRRERMCGNKVRHVSYEQAEEARKIAEEKHGWAMNSYPCPYCHNFHVGRAS